MAGLRMSVVVSMTAFLLGVLFTHWIADSLTLWKSPERQTDSRLWTAATYYTVLMHGPPELAYLYAAATICGGATLFWSLRDGRAGNLMFDGGSIFLYSTAIAMYIYSVIPNLTTNFATLPLPFNAPTPPSALPPFPATLREPTLELASSHLVCSVALTGVLVLQAGRWWAEQGDVDEDDDEPTVDEPERVEPERAKVA
ncbi:Shr3 amino acid permease chaperone [Epithele typhae]|uniref:Shr3 amino acid permease chaperone n=1 Tax=Epithele typhae TaxID=378194 RepID=UPI0020080594|nr:Shr3 amino acid permease chaperone [Epithele typhae]KAH9923944.1 Shr3 amino acid permease chaperone [Epithele typhae]